MSLPNVRIVGSSSNVSLGHAGLRELPLDVAAGDDVDFALVRELRDASADLVCRLAPVAKIGRAARNERRDE